MLRDRARAPAPIETTLRHSVESQLAMPQLRTAERDMRHNQQGSAGHSPMRVTALGVGLGALTAGFLMAEDGIIVGLTNAKATLASVAPTWELIATTAILAWTAGAWVLHKLDFVNF